MRKAIIVLVIIAAALLIGSCTTTFTASNGMLGYGEIEGRDVGDFEASDGYLYIIHPQILTLGGRPWETLEDLIEPELSRAGADAATDLAITSGFTTLDFILTYITGGILGFGHITVSGTALDQ